MHSNIAALGKAAQIHQLMHRYGIPVGNPLAGTSTALYGVATVDLWHWWGFLCVIFFAALRQVPQEQIEAARLEGASYWQMLRYVLLPGGRGRSNDFIKWVRERGTPVDNDLWRSSAPEDGRRVIALYDLRKKD